MTPRCPGEYTKGMLKLPQKPCFAIVGAGAIGCYYGGRLAQHGHDVHFLMRSDYEHVRRHGLSVKSHAGDFNLVPGQLHLYQRSADMPKADVVIVTLKTTANQHFSELIAPLLHEQSIIITLQNGLGNERQLAELFGEGRVIGGLAFVCVNRAAPGEIRHTEYGLIKIGELGRSISPRLSRLCEIFSSSQVPCQMLENLAQGRWEKLIWNVPFNGLGAAMGLATDRIVGCPEGIALVREIMAEVVATGRAAGVQMNDAHIEQNIARTLSMGPYRSSMQIDAEMGREIELDAIIGKPLAVAEKHAIATPKMRMLYQLLCIKTRCV